MNKGKLYVISAPSGAGKSSLIKTILTDPRCRNLKYAVSFTTREPRPGEKNGHDYIFVSREKFESMIKEDEFLEWIDVFGRFYGTGRHWITSQLESGRNIVADVDVVGARAFKLSYPEAILIFIIPPSLNELARRLKARHTEAKAELDHRLNRVANEISQRFLFDFLVINDDFQTAIQELEQIFNAGQGRSMADMESFWPIFFAQKSHLPWCPNAWQTKPVIQKS